MDEERTHAHLLAPMPQTDPVTPDAPSDNEEWAYYEDTDTDTESAPPPPPPPSEADVPITPSPLYIPPPRRQRTRDAAYAAYYEVLVGNLATHDLLGVLAPGGRAYPSRHLLSPALEVLRAVVAVHFPALEWDSATFDARLADLRGDRPESVAYSFGLYSRAVDRWFELASEDDPFQEVSRPGRIKEPLFMPGPSSSGSRSPTTPRRPAPKVSFSLPLSKPPLSTTKTVKRKRSDLHSKQAMRTKAPPSASGSRSGAQDPSPDSSTAPLTGTEGLCVGRTGVAGHLGPAALIATGC
ncbi:uncharacterized protein LOC62_04G006496 [Vanrija pseudolonga]|uniref:Uncharacterized protein n=1 Tax=Vanrija pseudolonga TaxID=143232 RepID=A0AAF0YDU9_9TREE|nr:hypothetical protein LOC62_04G006496 [Vanrija pseudolonga]